MVQPTTTHRLVRDVVAATWREQGVSCLAAGFHIPDRPDATIGLGRRAPGLGVPGPGTVFEIASLTKPFTALCLAVLVGRGQAALDDPVALPGGDSVTLARLATHTAGLAKRQSRQRRRLRHPRRPHWDLTGAEVDRLLRASVRCPVGTFAYSNLGLGLLGLELGRRAGVPYPELVQELVCRPLGLTRTGVRADGCDDRAVATRRGRRVPPWGNGVLAGAGDLRSCVADLLRFGRLWYGEGPDELVAAAALMRSRRIATGQGFEQELGWRVAAAGTTLERLWHGGGSLGFRAGMWIRPGSGTVFVALTSQTRNRNLVFDPLFNRMAAATA